MLVPFAELLEDARRADEAVAAFTCYDVETTVGVLQAAAERAAPAILLVSAAAFAAPGGRVLMAALCAAGREAPTRVCVQLDHVDRLEPVEAAFQLGAGAAMADGSRLPLEENVALVRAAVEAAERHGAAVEAELGRIEGDEDVAAAAAARRLTDPDEAASFVARTGAACLAVSIGNVHGRYAHPPDLDWSRLDAVRRHVDVPLSLHGASGLGAEDVERAIANGIRKVNYNTELRERYLEVTEAFVADARNGARVLELHSAQTAAVAAVVAEKLALVHADPERRETLAR